ncbi:sulfotransferase 1C2-like [Patiria miniata]|uniref:Sulfotransferase domain-containing protein n=1 Tax=Patiria miniata TaxID=46514 RepID=A0A914AQA6_PATMI|nr:sulfotransferase 1C2-like [Patiria miniata]XP_038066236.1 sulfotransferase 1C2-like [Patiria miniata]XP_038066237.1 sulfotransferase 1C2-like [Patiria miniata]
MDMYLTVEDFRDMRREMYTAQKPYTLGEYEGVPLNSNICKIMDELRSFEVRADDCWIVTYPKAGTTWLQEIMSAVMHDGNLEEVNKSHFMLRVPYFEQTFPEEVRRLKNLPSTHRIADEMPSPRVIKSHLPGQLLPPQIWTKKAKIVYVIRNPKDLMVSYFHFENMMNLKSAGLPFEEYLGYRNSKKASYGSWWDHYLYFWKRRHEPNVMVLRFEDLKRDLRRNVEIISRFLGKALSAKTLDDITKHCSFYNMKSNPMTNPDYLYASDERPGYSFMRKGKSGNWKTHFTVAQNESMDALIKEKLHGTGLTFDH